MQAINAVKVPFPILALEVEKLYARQFPIDAEAEINLHLEYIATYIQACGWTEDEYFTQWLVDQKETSN